MANYPTATPYSWQSKREIVGGTRTDVMTNGEVRSRSFFPNKLYRFTMLHEYITSTQAAELETLYDDNTTQTVTLTWKDSATYTVRFVDAPTVERMATAFYNVTSVLIGTKD